MVEYQICDKGGCTNWEICFICQEETKGKLRSTSCGLETLGEKLIKFSEINAVDFNINYFVKALT